MANLYRVVQTVTTEYFVVTDTQVNAERIVELYDTVGVRPTLQLARVSSDTVTWSEPVTIRGMEYSG